MRHLIFGLLFVLVAVPQDHQDSPKKEDSSFCTPQGDLVLGVQTSVKPCHCKHMNVSEDCDDPSMDFEDPSCTKSCTKDRCACPVQCDPNGQMPCNGEDC